MRRRHLYLSVLAAVAVSTVVTMASWRSQNGRVTTTPPAGGLTAKPNEDEWPVASFENSEQIDDKQRAEREAKSNHYNDSMFKVKGAVKSAREDFTVILTEDWEEGISPLPIPQSDVVLIGTILDAKAFVSTDQTGVYSEFTTKVDEVLKADGVAGLKSGDIVSLQRDGGRVQGRPGRVLFRIRGQNMPRRGGQYAMFLRCLDGGEDYKIITGYELRGGKIFPLDSVDKFAAYSGMDGAAFSQAIDEAIRRP